MINRLDEIIVFHKLSEDNINKIAQNMLNVFKQRVKKIDIDIDFTDEAVIKIAKVGYDQTYGARPLRRAITSNIEDKLSQKLLDGSIKKTDKVIIDVVDGEFFFKNA